MRPWAIVLAASLVAVCAAAPRAWQTGTWTDVGIKRQMIDFGPGGGGFSSQPSPTNPPMRAMAEVHTFVIETQDVRLELQEVVAVGHPSVEAVVGATVTFAIEKNAVYVKHADGSEDKLKVTKKIAKPKP